MRPSIQPRPRNLTGFDLADHIGRTGSLRVGELKIDVRIADARQVWGRLDYLVSPVAGQGAEWVSAERVALTP
jgi:hypothetical protein